MKTCTLPGCDVIFSTTDSHPLCFAHRPCDRTVTSGSAGGDACGHCSHWSVLQVEAGRKRRATLDRSRKRPPIPAATSRPSPDSVIFAVPAEMAPGTTTPGPSPPTLTPVLEEATRGDPASPAPKSPVPTETQAILAALSRVVERLDSLDNRERPSPTKRRPEARRSLDPESSSPPPKRPRRYGFPPGRRSSPNHGSRPALLGRHQTDSALCRARSRHRLEPPGTAEPTETSPDGGSIVPVPSTPSGEGEDEERTLGPATAGPEC